MIEEHKEIPTIVAKFGGSSICKSGVETIIKQVKSAVENNYRLIIVVSAIQKTTNNLMKIVTLQEDTIDKIKKDHIDFANSMGLDTQNLNYSLDILCTLVTQFKEDPSINITQQKIKIVSMGEILSSVLMADLLNFYKVPTKLINARQFIKSVNPHTKIDSFNLTMKGKFYCDAQSIKFLIDNKPSVYVTQGFVASTSDERFCVLSRSGSDTSASIIAAGIKAARLEIWTDVNGMFTANPNVITDAKLIEKIGYDVCQELAAAGSKVLHPYCIGPCKEFHIPIHIKNTFKPDAPFTVINGFKETKKNKVYAVSVQDNVTVFTIESEDMWENYGFVHDIFGVFKDSGIDVNIVTTSQFSISTTTEETSPEKLEAAAEKLKKKYKITMNNECSIISIIVNDIFGDTNLNKALEFINETGREHLHIKHYSSNNLNMSFVVDSCVCTKLVRMFHREFITKKIERVDNLDIWWRDNTKELLELYDNNNVNTMYVYSQERVKQSCTELKSHLSPTINQFYYAMKANNNRKIIKEIISNGFGLECVSINELKHALNIINDKSSTDLSDHIDTNILFTPNYCDVKEYAFAFLVDALVVVDNYNVLTENSGLFKDRSIGIRIDLDQGDGHNSKVITEGDNIKFGFPAYLAQQFKSVADILNIKIVFLHSHKGSGILNHKAWAETLCKMKPLLEIFTDVETIDLGGGLGIFTNGDTLDLTKVREEIDQVNDTNVKLVMEPGRFVVSEAGIILTKATQIRSKGSFDYLGVDAGMHTLVRPAMYGAHHPIYNLSRLDEESTETYQVVGPICESGDILGKNIKLPPSRAEDVILIENAGAYGQVMSCEYNMRNTAPEFIY